MFSMKLEHVNVYIWVPFSQFQNVQTNPKYFIEFAPLLTNEVCEIICFIHTLWSNFQVLEFVKFFTYSMIKKYREFKNKT